MSLGKLTIQARIFCSLADSTNRIARTLKISALDLRTFTVQYFARLVTKQEKPVKNQKLASGTIEKPKLTPNLDRGFSRMRSRRH
jgi:hypothetical protein